MTISATSTTETAAADINQQAGMLLQQVAGYVGSRTTQLGLRAGLVDALANANDGLTVDELAIQGRHRPLLRTGLVPVQPRVNRRRGRHRSVVLRAPGRQGAKP